MKPKVDVLFAEVFEVVRQDSLVTSRGESDLRDGRLLLEDGVLGTREWPRRCSERSSRRMPRSFQLKPRSP